MEHSEQINEIAFALSKAQSSYKKAFKDNLNSHFNSKYSDLNSFFNACRESLSENSLAVVQTMGYNGDKQLCLITTLCHSSGQFFKSYLPIKYSEESTEINKYGKEIKSNPLQKLGSCLTYLRRYAFASIVGIAPEEDDDGNSAYSDDSSQRKYEKIQERSAPDPFISSEKVEILSKLYKQCDSSFQEKVLARLKRLKMSWFNNIPENEYETWKKGFEDCIEMSPSEKTVETKEAIA
jgi:hypothetical protein